MKEDTARISSPNPLIDAHLEVAWKFISEESDQVNQIKLQDSHQALDFLLGWKIVSLEEDSELKEQGYTWILESITVFAKNFGSFRVTRDSSPSKINIEALTPLDPRATTGVCLDVITQNIARYKADSIKVKRISSINPCLDLYLKAIWEHLNQYHHNEFSLRRYFKMFINEKPVLTLEAEITPFNNLTPGYNKRLNYTHYCRNIKAILQDSTYNIQPFDNSCSISLVMEQDCEPVLSSECSLILENIVDQINYYNIRQELQRKRKINRQQATNSQTQ